MNILQVIVIIIGSFLIIYPGVISVIEFGLSWPAFSTLVYFGIGGFFIILALTKLGKNWKLRVEKEGETMLFGIIDKFPPLKRQYAINKILRLCSISLFLLSTIGIAYMFTYYPPSSEESLTSFFNNPTTPVLFLTSIVAVTAGVLLWRIKKLGAILAIAAFGLTITSMILIVNFTSNLYISISGTELLRFAFYVPISGYSVVYVIKYWKDLKPLIHKI